MIQQPSSFLNAAMFILDASLSTFAGKNTANYAIIKSPHLYFDPNSRFHIQQETYIESLMTFRNAGRVISNKIITAKLGDIYSLGYTEAKEKIILEATYFLPIARILAGHYPEYTHGGGLHLITNHDVSLDHPINVLWSVALSAPSITVKQPIVSAKALSLSSIKENLIIEALLLGSELSLRAAKKLETDYIQLKAFTGNIEAEAGCLISHGTHFNAPEGMIKLHPNGSLYLTTKETKGKNDTVSHKKTNLITKNEISLRSNHGVCLKGVDAIATRGNIHVLSKISPEETTTELDGIICVETPYDISESQQLKKNKSAYRKSYTPQLNTFTAPKGRIQFEGIKKIVLESPVLKSAFTPVIKSQTGPIDITTHFQSTQTFSQEKKSRKIIGMKVGEKTTQKETLDRTNHPLISSALTIIAPTINIEFPVNNTKRKQELKEKSVECNKETDTYNKYTILHNKQTAEYNRLKAEYNPHKSKSKKAKKILKKRNEFQKKRVESQQKRVESQQKNITKKQNNDLELKTYEERQNKIALSKLEKKSNSVWITEYKNKLQVILIPIDDEHKNHKKPIGA